MQKACLLVDEILHYLPCYTHLLVQKALPYVAVVVDYAEEEMDGCYFHQGTIALAAIA